MAAPNEQTSILMVTSSFAAEDGGTTQCVVNTALAHHALRTAEVTMAYGTSPSHRDQEAVARLSTGGVELVPLRSWRPRKGLVRMWALSVRGPWWLLRNAGGFDVVQIHGAWHWLSLWGAVAARIHGVACLLQPHETLTEFDIATSQQAITRSLKRCVVHVYRQLVGYTIFSSDLEADDSVAVSESAVVAHPVTEHAHPARRTPAGETRIYGYLGRLHPKKRVGLLLEAFSRASIGHAQLKLAGTGEEEGALRRQGRQLGIDNRTEWLGFLPAAEVGAFLESIDVLVMPSAYECFGMSAAEALSQGRPVIVTDRVGLAPLVSEHECGWVTQVDIATLIAAMEEAADASIVAERGARAVSAAEDFLSYRAYARQTAEVYLTLIDRTR